MENQNTVLVRPYQEYLHDEVIALFLAEYGGERGAWSKRFRALYDDPYQSERSIRLVATCNNHVAGFQSLFHWPYHYGGRRLNCLQSGNSLVSPAYRGKGIFSSLLKEVDEVVKGHDADALIGFPVDASLGSFVRSGWKHLGDLQWYIRLVSPLPAVFGAPFPTGLEQTERMPFHAYTTNNDFTLSERADFLSWREKLYDQPIYMHKNYIMDGADIEFDLKFERRGRLNIATIGRIRSPEPFADFMLNKAIANVISDISKMRSVSFVAIACNASSYSGGLVDVLRRNLFLKINRKRVHFVLKPLKDDTPEMLEFARWRLFRGDVDTW